MNVPSGRMTALALCMAMFASREAAADEPARGPAFKLSLDVDASLLLVSGGLASGFFLLDEVSAPRCAPLCDRKNINALDRGSAGNYSPTWGKVGDVAVAATMLAGPASLLIAEGLGAGLNDSLVAGEAALVTSALQVTISYATQRPRPRVYGTRAPEDERNDANAGRSFFSGHVANGVAVTLATTRAFMRLDRPALAWTMFGIGMAGSTLIGVSRIQAGSHFPTDVVIGGLVGAGVGLAIPALHAPGRRLPNVQAVPIVTDSGAFLSVSGLL